MNTQLTTELVNLTVELMRYKTVDGNHTAQEACIRHIARYLSDVPNLHFSQYEERGYPSLVVTTKNTKAPDVMLNGHIDVVPGDDSLFRPDVRGGKIYGRGSMDMKAGVATIVHLFKALASQEKSPDIGLMITSDEECGGKHGAGYLTEREGWRAQFILTPEGKDTFTLVNREKGVAWLKLAASGAAAHSAYPWKGKNALEMLIQAYRDISALFPAAKDSWQSTVNLSQVRTPDGAVNQVPVTAEAILDIRYTSDFSPSISGVLEKVRAAAPQVDVELLVDGQMLYVPEDNELLRHLQNIATKRAGTEVPLGYNHGASDAAWFAARGIPAMVSGIVGNGHHSPDEYVEVDSMVRYYDIAREFIETFPAA